MEVPSGIQGITIPTTCDRCVHRWIISYLANLFLFSEADPTGSKPKCPMDPYIVIHHKSTFIDQQMLKLQEPLGMVPVGELPRHLTLSADR